MPVQMRSRGSPRIAARVSVGQLEELSAVDDQGIGVLAERESGEELVGSQDLGLRQQLGEELTNAGLSVADPQHAGHVQSLDHPRNSAVSARTFARLFPARVR